MPDTVMQLLREPLVFLDQTLYRVLAVMIALCCHECGHAYAAYRCGDLTAKRMGRLTLNPLKHLDPVGTALMFFVGFGWAKPVPVNPYNYRGDRRRADLIVSLAGITVNLILFILFTVLTAFASLGLWRNDVIREYGLTMLMNYDYNAIWMIISGSGKEAFGALFARGWLLPLVRLFALTALINLNFAVFNLLPLPPLDGYHVFNDIVLRGRFEISPRIFRIGMIVVMVLCAQGAFSGIIRAAISPIQGLVLYPFALIWG